jgi:putative tryptophan/tyrosine transport system substrate-binding protein
MQRRDFIALLGGAAIASPLVARAQQMRRLGVLMAAVESDPVAHTRLGAFEKAFEELGWHDGQNVHIEYRWAGGDVARIRSYAAELAGLNLDVILANGTTAIAALKQIPLTTPVVFVIVNDPVAQGFVASQARPGGNITGFSFMDYTVLGKSVEFLKAAAPGITRFGFLFNPDTYPYYEVYLRSLLTDAHAMALQAVPARVRTDSEIDGAVTSLALGGGAGLVVPPDAFTGSRRDRIVKLTLDNRLPTIASFHEFVTYGGLMSYGPDQTDIFRRSAAYVDRILKGEHAGDLPVQAPTKFELFINATTAKAFGLTLPQTLLTAADEVVE